jgi:hypothetical protein
VDDRLLRKKAADACQILGGTLEMGLTLPPVELASGYLAEPIVFLKDVAVAFLRVLNLVLKSRGAATTDSISPTALSKVITPFLAAATTAMKMLASHGSST